MLISDPSFYAVVIPAIVLVGISKGGFGGGVGLIGTPMVALVTTPTRAAAILLPILCAMDIVGVIAYRRSWDPVNMRILVPGSVLGILLGTATFRFLDENLIRLMIGVLAAFAIGAVPAIVLGMLMGWSRALRKVVDPFIAAFHPVPKVALLPLFMIVLGVGEASKVVIAALSAFSRC